MKSTLSNKPTFPCLMQASNPHIVVLMTEDSTGTVVFNSDPTCELIRVGDFSNVWAMTCFTLYNGAITLSN